MLPQGYIVALPEDHDFEMEDRLRTKVRAIPTLISFCVLLQLMPAHSRPPRPLPYFLDYEWSPLEGGGAVSLRGLLGRAVRMRAAHRAPAPEQLHVSHMSALHHRLGLPCVFERSSARARPPAVLLHTDVGHIAMRLKTPLPLAASPGQSPPPGGAPAPRRVTSASPAAVPVRQLLQKVAEPLQEVVIGTDGMLLEISL